MKRIRPPLPSRRPTAVFAALALCGCGAAPPAADDPASLSRRFPPRAYVVAKGEGESRASAERAAQVAVAEQLSARLAARIQTTEREADGRGSRAVQADVQSETSFARAELIEVRAELTRCEGGRCFAVATLDRGRAREALETPLLAALADLERAAARARAATDDRTLAAALSDAEEATARALTDVVPLAAIAGGPVPEETRVRTLIGEVVALRDARLAGLRLTLDLSGLDAELSAPVGQALVQAFAQLGLDARPGGTCADGLRFAPAGSVRCGRSPLGPRCALDLRGQLATCAGEAISALQLGDSLQAVHPRSPEEARARLLRALPQTPLVQALRGALVGVIPLRP